MKMTVPGGDLFGAKGALWANMGISKTLFNESLEISLGIDNLYRLLLPFGLPLRF